MKKNKVGILTFHRSINNGAFMQCYSLSKRLSEELDCAVEVIDYNTAKIDKLYKKQVIKSRPFTVKDVFARFCMYCSFRKVLKTLPLSDFTEINDDFKNLFDKMRDTYDAVIVGSDAVWNWTSRGFPNAYWLNMDFDGKLYSYAASVHGMNLEKVTDDQLSYCKEALGKYSFIGVRDSNTEAFVERISPDLSPVHTCDPTIFLDMDKIPCDVEKLKEKLKKKYKISFKKPIIGLMSENEKIGKLVHEKYGDKYDIVAVFQNNKYAKYFLYDLTPYEWSRVFSLFDLTFSQYFHGTLLSLKNLTPVVAIDVWKLTKNTVAKIEDVFNRTGFSHCYFKVSDLSEETISKIYELADDMLENPPKEKIAEALANEAKTADAFFRKIKEDLKND